jgi:hypothetical protein
MRLKKIIKTLFALLGKENLIFVLEKDEDPIENLYVSDDEAAADEYEKIIDETTRETEGYIPVLLRGRVSDQILKNVGNKR